ncbi:hypothetical protein AB4037_13395 [Labrys sp. KB_33_2]|uniref:hypothetical protein n=1 Tax=Labrys sp. KB_33_2 TaxID=3237479 RepID=UPI003F8E4E3A
MASIEYRLLTTAIGVFFGVVSCTPNFSMSGWEYEASIRREFVPGSDFLTVKRALLSRGFRQSSEDNRYGFSFSNTKGYFVCGQVISGALTEDGKVSRIGAYQGCFRTLAP